MGLGDDNSRQNRSDSRTWTIVRQSIVGNVVNRYRQSAITDRCIVRPNAFMQADQTINTMSEQNSFVDEYRPESFSDIQGNNKNLKKIKSWAKNWEPGDKPILLHGKPGTGKTTTAEVVADYMGYPLQEMNTSDDRTAESLERLIRSIKTTPVDAERQVVLLDEADSWHHATNLKPLVDALKESKNPVIMTANSKYDTPNSLTRVADEYKFSLRKSSKRAKLKEIVEAEGLEGKVDGKDIESLAEREDLRAAINDLQRWAEEDLPPKNDSREFETTPWESVRGLIGGTSTDSGRGMTPEDTIMWVDENARKHHRGVEAMAVYDTLARADRWAGLTRQTQNYHWWKYAGELVDHVGRLRLQPASDSYMNVETPTWFKSSMPNATGDSPTARVYQKMKDVEDGTFQFGGGYTYFRKVLLPIIKDQPLGVRKRMVKNYRLEKDEAEVIGVSKREYNKLFDDSVPEERQKTEAEINQESATISGW